MFTRFDKIHERDRYPDGQTASLDPHNNYIGTGIEIRKVFLPRRRVIYRNDIIFMHPQPVLQHPQPVLQQRHYVFCLVRPVSVLMSVSCRRFISFASLAYRTDFDEICGR